MIEIERKFLVTSTSFMDEAFSSKRIVQAYICSDPERTVRIRIKETRAFITIKGKGKQSIDLFFYFFIFSSVPFFY